MSYLGRFRATGSIPDRPRAGSGGAAGAELQWRGVLESFQGPADRKPRVPAEGHAEAEPGLLPVALLERDFAEHQVDPAVLPHRKGTLVDGTQAVNDLFPFARAAPVVGSAPDVREDGVHGPDRTGRGRRAESPAAGAARHRRDRKSTRLNSSH